MSQIQNIACAAARLEKQANIKAITQAGKSLMGQAPEMLSAAKSGVTGTPKVIKNLPTQKPPKLGPPKPMPRPPRAARGDNLPSWVKQNLSKQHGIRSYNQLRDGLPAMQSQIRHTKPSSAGNAELSKLLKILGDFGWNQ